MVATLLFVLGAAGCSSENDYETKGLITGIVDSGSFLIGNILVTHDSSTRFEYGDADDLAVGKRVEVEGSRTSSGTIIAREIEFEDAENDYYEGYSGDYYDDDRDDYYEIEGRITEIVNSGSFLIGNILVTHDSSTRFEYGDAGDLAVGKRVEVEGSRTDSGTVIAREIEFEDAENDYYEGYSGDYYDDDRDDYYEIEGRITEIVNSGSFLIGNILVTHDSSTRFEYGDAGDLAVGKRVEVEGSRTSSGTIIAREIEFED